MTPRSSILTAPAPGEPELMVEWKRSARARRISLKVSRLDGRITLTLPVNASIRNAEVFLAERANWLRAAVRGVQRAEPIEAGAILPVRGESLRLERARVRRVTREGETLLLPMNGRTGALVANWLKLEARGDAAEAIARHAQGLGSQNAKAPGKLRLADPRGRWGSCAASGDIMLSWRLLLAPPAILDYVAAHEVAHLAQMNHSPAFWAQLEALLPGYAAPRDWLRRNGAGLHRYRFDTESA